MQCVQRSQSDVLTKLHQQVNRSRIVGLFDRESQTNPACLQIGGEPGTDIGFLMRLHRSRTDFNREYGFQLYQGQMGNNRQGVG